MNIVIISPAYLMKNTVATQRMDSLISFLMKKSTNITVLCDAISDKRKYDFEEGINLVEINNRQYYFALQNILNKRKIDVIIITLGPFFTLPIVSKVKKEFDIKIILDYRDLWTFDFRGTKDIVNIKKFLKRFVSYFVEKKAINLSDMVVTVTEPWAKKIRKYFNQKDDKVKIISNGFDEKIFDNIAICNKTRKDNVIDIYIFGKLSYYSKKYSQKLFETIESMKKFDDGVEVILNHIGLTEQNDKEILEKYPLARYQYKNVGYLDYVEGINLMNNKADAFLIVDNRKEALGTKIYDYIALNRPILYVGPKQTLLSKIIMSFKNGFSCQNSKDIEEAMNKIMVEKHLDENIGFDKYSRKYQNKKYYELIKQLIEKQSNKNNGGDKCDKFKERL